MQKCPGKRSFDWLELPFSTRLSLRAVWNRKYLIFSALPNFPSTLANFTPDVDIGQRYITGTENIARI
jgi:hypothetical protein